MLNLGQNYICWAYAPIVIKFAMLLLKLIAWISEIPVLQVTNDPGWLLSVPSAIIKFSYFRSQPGAAML